MPYGAVAALSRRRRELGTRIELAHAPGARASGWHRLDLDGGLLAGCKTASLIVALDVQPAAWIEYPLPLGCAREPQRHVLHIRERFCRALLIADSGVALRSAGARLARISAPRLALLAARRHPMEALRAAAWRIAGKRVRARHRLLRLLAPLPCFDFRDWTGKQGETAPQAAAIDARQAGVLKLVICVAVADGETVAAQTEQSLRAQPGTDWTMVPVSTAAELGVALDRARDHWLVHLVNGEVVEPGALLRIAREIVAAPGAALIYWDDTVPRGDGLLRVPRLKPDWNADLQWAQDYIGSAAISSAAALAAGGAAADAGRAAWFDLVTRVAQAAGANGVRHMPHVLSHRPAGIVDDVPARAACVARLTGAAACEVHGHVRVTWPLPDPPPRVSLIVPTRDRLDLLEPCLEGLLERTGYSALEVLIADNGSRGRRTRVYLDGIARDPRVRVIPLPGPFNFSAINNRAAGLARGQVLGFLNNDIEVIAPDWLTEMVAHALRPDVGAVGAKLLYPSGLVQHAGVIVGLDGLAGHAHRFYPAKHPGYMGRLQCTQMVSAVTAACLLMRRDVFLQAGGFDEHAFPVAYNDVDLCLRLGTRGFKTVWTPHAVLRHKESATRERDYAKRRLPQYRQESAAFRRRWARVIAHDPHYHPHLTRTDERFLP